MKILIVGSGGREHALAWKLAQSPLVTDLIAAPGNPGMADHARCVPIKSDDVPELVSLAVREAVDLVVVGPEAPLALGLADKLRATGIQVFGPSQAAAQLESSKAFTKDFCARHSIPTAQFAVFDKPDRARKFLDTMSAPYVLKADGLAAGKGVIIADTRQMAEDAIEEILFRGRFGDAGSRIVIEEFMAGEEASVFAICDGTTAIMFGAAQDHKRAFDGDKGPNTGGMGAYSPCKVVSDAILDRVRDEIILPTMAGMAAEGMPFVGVLFAGLMIDAQGPRLIEYNARFGDPECQTLMLRLTSDLAPLLAAAAAGTLADQPAPIFSPETAIAVVMAANGYPDAPLTGSQIRGVSFADNADGAKVFHAGTKLDDDGTLRANGGRVLNVCAVGPDLGEAVTRAYVALDRIDWPGGFARRDIGHRGL